MLKALLLKRKIDLKQRDLDKLMAKRDELNAEAGKLAADLEKVEDIDQETTDAVDAKEQEIRDNDSSIETMEQEIAQLRADLAEAEKDQEGAEAPKPEKPMKEERSEKGMNIPEMNINDKRAALVQREEVKNWLGEIRTAMKEKRAITNVGLTIPEVMLGLLKENILGYSKLYGRVDVRRIGGTGRMLIMGTTPEAIWTDCCANLNELTLAFADLEVDCYKVGGYFAVCNANLEDSDVNLAGEILTALGQAIGLALDKAILYGRNASGTMKMPQGIVSRLAQTSQPSGYPATARAWADLHTSNMITVSADNSTGVKLIQALVGAAGKCRNNYSRGGLTWCMNEATYTKLITEMVVINASGAIVSGIGATMPVVGGDIVILPFMGNDQIVVGYFGLYLLAERAGNQFASSEHVRFLSDETVFKGTARYDGAPEIAESFVAIGIGGTSPSANMTFTGDTANDVETVWLPATATVAANATITLTPVVAPNNAKTTFTWASATTAKATVSDAGVVTGVAAGTSVITVTTANGKSAQCTVTVTSA